MKWEGGLKGPLLTNNQFITKRSVAPLHHRLRPLYCLRPLSVCGLSCCSTEQEEEEEQEEHKQNPIRIR